MRPRKTIQERLTKLIGLLDQSYPDYEQLTLDDIEAAVEEIEVLRRRARPRTKNSRLVLCAAIVLVSHLYEWISGSGSKARKLKRLKVAASAHFSVALTFDKKRPGGRQRNRSTDHLLMELAKFCYPKDDDKDHRRDYHKYARAAKKLQKLNCSPSERYEVLVNRLGGISGFIRNQQDPK